MKYMEKTEIVLVGYYNVLFFLTFRMDADEYKKDILAKRINSGEIMMMKDIYEWCQKQQIPLTTKFIYRKNFPIKANLWNLYSYIRFKLELFYCKHSELHIIGC